MNKTDNPSDMSRRSFLEMAASITAGTASCFGQTASVQDFGLPPGRVTVLRSKDPRGAETWPDVVATALAKPLGQPRLSSQDLRGKRVVVMTDDWGRPTPASQVVPLILDELHAAGVEDKAITFVTASGMHDPMKPEDLARKLGKEVTERFRCISHDAGDPRMLVFCGISDLGTPIWINRHVAEADYKVALGRIALHVTYGYEGGYKMIVPGVAGYDTILRDHSMNFSRFCVPGRSQNPSRREAEAIGAQVGIDFLVNVVVNSRDEPVRAFAGKVEQVHPEGVRFGDREVWGAATPWRSNVTVVTLGPGETLSQRPTSETLRRAMHVTREAGAIIIESKSQGAFQPRIGDRSADEDVLNSADVASFNAMLRQLSLPELLRIHEKRDYRLDARTIQQRVKAVRSQFYELKPLVDSREYNILLTPDPTTALRNFLDKGNKADARVNIIAGARTTLPIVEA